MYLLWWPGWGVQISWKGILTIFIHPFQKLSPLAIPFVFVTLIIPNSLSFIGWALGFYFAFPLCLWDGREKDSRPGSEKLHNFDLTAQDGLILKNENRLIIDGSTTAVWQHSNGIFSKGESYKKIRTRDIVGIRSVEGGIRSRRALLIGALLLYMGLSLLISSPVDSAIWFYLIVVGGLLVAYAFIRQFKISIDYLARSLNLPVVNLGTLEFTGSGPLPIDVGDLSSAIFGGNGLSNPVESFRVRSSTISALGAMRQLLVYPDALVFHQGSGFLLGKEFNYIPMRNVISVVSYPSKFKSPRSILVGIFFLLSGLASYPLLLLGILLIAYGLQRMVRMAVTYATVEGKVFLQELEGIAIDSMDKFNFLGETIMNQALAIHQGGIPA